MNIRECNVFKLNWIECGLQFKQESIVHQFLVAKVWRSQDFHSQVLGDRKVSDFSDLMIDLHLM